MAWKSPDASDAALIVSSAAERLLVCSPFLSTYGLNIAKRAHSDSLQSIEVWTRLELRDWVTGASEPDALLDYLDTLPGNVSTQIYASPGLHAKFLLADDTLAWAGSSNLTAGGFLSNIELGKLIEPPEIIQFLEYVEETRELLSPVNRAELRAFVTECQRRTEDREALLELVRDAGPSITGGQPLIPLKRFIDFCKRFSSDIADEIRVIYYNTDRNNRTGHLKQAYYAVQRFLQENPQHASFAAALPEEPFDLRGTEIEGDWHGFLAAFSGDEDAELGYDLRILVDTYLTPAFGGERIGGGGGDYPFKLVWPYAGRLLEP